MSRHPKPIAWWKWTPEGMVRDYAGDDHARADRYVSAMDHHEAIDRLLETPADREHREMHNRAMQRINGGSGVKP